ncbi:hypothetical protein [Actibacterium sp. XHP0104]|uniref:hypothetical protein n=1 Tax=Actibacterium sp. XHP0104 TaxID=2984335 RepID=UPI0021E7156C|nr:hypothetical protein [Actibacterium sp. XHP0104]MCV2882965.1 hypothetical protein [Actibacterium sp. XHP0104]
MTPQIHIEASLSLLAGKSDPIGTAGRIIDGRDGVSAIVREIDQTVLKRTLFIGNGEGGEIALDVAGRRLLCLRSINFPLVRRAYHRLCDKPLSEDSIDELMDLFELLEMFVERARDLTILTERRSSDGWAGDIGISAARLAEGWMLTLYPQAVDATAQPAPAEEEDEPGLAGFLRRCDGLYSAALVLEGDQPLSQIGDENALVALAEASARRKAPLALVSGLVDTGADAPYFSLLRDMDDGGQMMAVAGCGAETVLLMAPADNLSQISTMWQAAA